jgi:hypothetical protein
MSEEIAPTIDGRRSSVRNVKAVAKMGAAR